METSKPMKSWISVGGVALIRDFEDVEAEFGFQMSGGIFGVGDDVAVLVLQIGIEHRDGAIDGDGVAVVVCGVVGERAEREGVIVEILRIVQEGADEIGAANVVHDVAEFVAAVRVIAQILNDGAAVGVSVGGAEFVVRGVRKACQEQRADAFFPGGIDDGFVSKDGVGLAPRRAECQQQQYDASDGGGATDHDSDGCAFDAALVLPVTGYTSRAVRTTQFERKGS